jgi:hypothetical protein
VGCPAEQARKTDQGGNSTGERVSEDSAKDQADHLFARLCADSDGNEALWLQGRDGSRVRLSGCLRVIGHRLRLPKLLQKRGPNSSELSRNPWT